MDESKSRVMRFVWHSGIDTNRRSCSIT